MGPLIGNHPIFLSLYINIHYTVINKSKTKQFIKDDNMYYNFIKRDTLLEIGLT